MTDEYSQQMLALQSWLECIGDLDQKKHPYITSMNQEQMQPNLFCQINNQKQYNQSISSTVPTPDSNLSQIQDHHSAKRHRQNTYYQQQFSQDKMSSSENSSKEAHKHTNQLHSQNKKDPNSKQSLYSKCYRERKKEKIKIIQEENNFLKNKINQLQFRLRQKELEINRIKYPPLQKDLTIQNLNQEFLNKTNLLLSKTAVDPQKYGKRVCTSSDAYYIEFCKSYDQHGIGGTRKKNILNYFFNQLLETVIKDSEKYLFLMCNKSKDCQSLRGLETYQIIDSVFFQVIQLDENKIDRIKLFTRSLHPFMIELNQICGEFYSSYRKIVSFVQKVHNFMKQSYMTNMDFARKRIEFQNWFDSQKHTKIMRRLRSEWFDFIKQSAQNDSQKKKNSKGKKKKKLPHD